MSDDLTHSNARSIAVFGASGHTGAFVLSEVQRRGFSPVACGRSIEKLNAVADRIGIKDVRVASVSDVRSMEQALRGADAVINCAGPFGETAIPVIEAARRARIPYVDVTAEAAVVLDIFDRYAEQLRDIAVVPAMAFYGGLGDLLATAAMGDWSEAQEIIVAYGLSSWVPTDGTRATIAKRGGRRLVFRSGRIEQRTDETPAPHTHWTFGSPFGEQEVATEITTADVVTIPNHLRVRDVQTYMNLAPISNLLDTSVTGPVSADETGRSNQEFRVEVVVQREGEERRAVASGRDIYATTAPLVVEAVERLLRSGITGVRTAARAFNATDFLSAMERADPFFRIEHQH